MKPSDDANTTDADDSIHSRLPKTLPKKPINCDTVDLMEEFKRKYHDILIDDNNHETDHRGG